MENKSLWRFWLGVSVASTLLVVALYYLLQVRIISVPIILALVLTLFLEPIVIRLESKGISRTKVVSALFLVGIATISIVGYIGGDIISSQLSAFSVDAIPRAQGRLSIYLSSIEFYLYNDFPFSIQVDLQSKLSAAVEQLQGAVIPELPSIIGSIIAGGLIVPIVTFFFLKDGRAMRKKLISYVPNRYFEMSLMIFYRSSQSISSFIQGVGKQSFWVGMVDFVALLIVGVDLSLALALGAFGGLINIIPYVGPVIGYGVAGLVALTLPGDPPIVGMVLAMVCGQVADNVVIGPLLIGSAVNIHPIAVILLCIIGGKMMGVLGLILIVPLFAVGTAIAQEFYRGIRSYNQFSG